MESVTLILTRDFIHRHVRSALYLDAVRTAFVRLAAAQLHPAPVVHLPGVEGAFHIKSAVSLVAPRRAAVKVNGNYPHNHERFELPAIQGFIALLDAERGSLLALMDSGEITGRRTAATSAVAAQALARADSRRLAIIGCGVQAHYHLEAFAPLFPLETVALYDCVPQRAHEFASRIAAQGFLTGVAECAASAAVTADIVITCTPSRAAVLRSEDVQPGCFIAAVGADSAGKQELAPELLQRARVVPDVLAQALHMGDLQHALAAGLMTANDVHGELADLVGGRVAGRRTRDEIFVFDSTGTAVADLAAAEAVYDSVRHRPDALRVRLSD